MEKNKTKIVTIASLLALVMLIIGATYAYFAAQTGEGSQTDIRINANTVDTLTFETGDPITLTLDQENFAQGTGNQTGSTFAKALLTANSKTNTATEHYYMYLNISENTFTYTQDANTPEILLSIKNEAGEVVSSIPGFTYKNVTDGKGVSLSGFDITNEIGLITLFDNREITTTSTLEEQWNVTITFVNYNADQTGNAGKSFSATLMIQKAELSKTISDVCSGSENLANCITSLNQEYGAGATNVYYHDSNLVNGAKDNSYRYASGDGCSFNNRIVQGVSSNAEFGASSKENCKNVFYLTSGNWRGYLDDSVNNILSDKKSVTWSNNACKTTDGESINIGFNNGNFDAITEETCKDDSYIVTTDSMTVRVANITMEYAGMGSWNQVDNFVCFGSDASPCPTDNLYRIIGVIDDKVKLIKYDYASSTLLGTDGDYSQNAEEAGMPTNYYKGTKEMSDIGVYYWNYKATNKATNTWSTSLLNKTNLNTNFINNIGTEWSNKIATTIWKVGGNTYAKIRDVVPSVAYQNEIVNPVPGQYSTTGETEYEAKIGLMYVSDYGFAASPSVWTLAMSTYNNTAATSNNWMYMGAWEWTVSRLADGSDTAFYVYNDGNVYYNYVHNYDAVRPSFNLESSITYKSGSGSMSDPIVIN